MYGTYPMTEQSILTEQKPPLLYVVTPCYNEEAGLVNTVNAVAEKLRQLQKDGKIAPGSAMLFSDDGSKDSTWQILEAAHRQHPDYVKAVQLAANRGKEYALWAGVMEAKKHADAVICMDADLQFDINAIDEFLALHAKGYELVYGIKKTRGEEPFFKRIFSSIFYSLMTYLGSPISRNHTDYCLMTRQVCNALAEYGETNLIFRGLIKQLGFKQCPCCFEVKDRAAGESHFSPVKLLNLSLDAITSFSVAPPAPHCLYRMSSVPNRYRHDYLDSCRYVSRHYSKRLRHTGMLALVSGRSRYDVPGCGWRISGKAVHGS